MSSLATQQLEANYRNVVADIAACAREINVPAPRLVAVSKYKPKEDIQTLYDLGHRHFGENYVQELTEKSEALPKDIQWHFIGSLQTNKCKVLAPIENLYAVETLDSESKAQKLNNARQGPPLNVFIQVNTSGEEQKSGLNSVDDIVKVGKFIVDGCPNLVLKGLMTIGSLSSSLGEDENEDFKVSVF
jgi:pyridoxal phosphate enzyme (YggS family)